MALTIDSHVTLSDGVKMPREFAPTATHVKILVEEEQQRGCEPGG